MVVEEGDDGANSLALWEKNIPGHGNCECRELRQEGEGSAKEQQEPSVPKYRTGVGGDIKEKTEGSDGAQPCSHREACGCHGQWVRKPQTLLRAKAA